MSGQCEEEEPIQVQLGKEQLCTCLMLELLDAGDVRGMLATDTWCP